MRKETKEFIKLFNHIESEIITLSSFEKEFYMQEWFNAVVPAEKQLEAKKSHCFDDDEACGYLWHVFSYKILNPIEGNEAKRAFDNIEKQGAILLENWDDIALKISGISNITAGHLDTLRDVIITDLGFSWTYVKTHESDCGPYFYYIHAL